MIRSIIPYKIKASRNGIADLWNAGMVSNTTFSAQNDIPLCPTTATSIPKCLIGFDEAKTFHNRQLKAGHAEYHVNAFIHFYIDDQKFDGPKGTWNGLSNNVSFILDSVENVIDKFHNIDCIIVDPPRKGLDKKSLFEINRISPKSIIYVSCDIVTLMRDLSFFQDNYVVKYIKPFNMFPRTYHCESIAVLERR